MGIVSHVLDARSQRIEHRFRTFKKVMEEGAEVEKLSEIEHFCLHAPFFGFTNKLVVNLMLRNIALDQKQPDAVRMAAFERVTDYTHFQILEQMQPVVERGFKARLRA